MRLRRAPWVVWLCLTAQLLLGSASMNAVLCIAGRDHTAVESSHELTGCPVVRGDASVASASSARRCVDFPLLQAQQQSLTSPVVAAHRLFARVMVAIADGTAGAPSRSFRTVWQGEPSTPVVALRALRTIVLLV